MKYYAQTTKYLAKNGIYLLPFAILPALFFAFSIDQTSVVEVFKSLFAGDFNIPFTYIFRAFSLFNYASTAHTLLGLVGVVLLIVCVSMIMAFLEKHMRIGKRSFNGLFSKVNDNVLSTGFIILLFATIYQLWALITSAAFYIFTFIKSSIAVYTLWILTYLASRFFMVYFLSYFYLWLPSLQLTGFKAIEAFRASYVLVSPVQFRISLSQFISLVVLESAIFLAVWFFSGWLVSFIVAALSYVFVICVFFVRMQIVYFDRAELDRADLKNKYYV
ncbi:MAG: hypothetical protein IJV80_01635 [Clostridia bacterium]|nr:hypothetical protein [Clostridia bacterium]